jgi:hypothetical protein
VEPRPEGQAVLIKANATGQHRLIRKIISGFGGNLHTWLDTMGRPCHIDFVHQGAHDGASQCPKQDRVFIRQAVLYSKLFQNPSHSGKPCFKNPIQKPHKIIFDLACTPDILSDDFFGVLVND